MNLNRVWCEYPTVSPRLFVFSADDEEKISLRKSAYTTLYRNDYDCIIRMRFCIILALHRRRQWREDEVHHIVSFLSFSLSPYSSANSNALSFSREICNSGETSFSCAFNNGINIRWSRDLLWSSIRHIFFRILPHLIPRKPRAVEHQLVETNSFDVEVSLQISA